MMWALMDSDSEEAMPAATWASIVNSRWMLSRRFMTPWASGCRRGARAVGAVPTVPATPQRFGHRCLLGVLSWNTDMT